MDFVNKAVAQLSDLFRSMTPAARITAGMLLVVIVVSITYLFNHQFSSGDAYLFGGEAVSANEIPAMQAAFGKAGLNDAEFEGNRIRVPRGKQAAYVAALADAGALPHNFGDVMKHMLESSNFMVSKAKQQEMTKHALQIELANIIRQMQGIEQAAVFYDVQSQGGLYNQKSISASVQVKPQGNQSLNVEQVKMIRYTVSGALAGLAPESVSVIDLNGRTFPGGAPGSDVDASQDPYLSRKSEYQQKFADSISQALLSLYVKGAVVTVNVDLNPVIEDVESTTRIDPKAVPILVTEKSQTLNSSTAVPSGRPGLVGQGGVNAPATLSGANGSKTEDEKSDRSERSLAGQESHQIKKAGLTPKRVTVSVGVPSSYFEDIWRFRNPSPPGSAAKKPEQAALDLITTEETARIQKYVTQVLPAVDETSKDVVKQVFVNSFPSLPVAEIEKPGAADHAMMWFSNHASSVGMGVLALFCLLMVRSILRGVPAPVATTGEPELKVATLPVDDLQEAEVTVGDMPQSRLRRRRSKSGPSLRDELVEIVRDDPDAAANILRSWIGSAN